MTLENKLNGTATGIIGGISASLIGASCASTIAIQQKYGFITDGLDLRAAGDFLSSYGLPILGAALLAGIAYDTYKYIKG